MAALDQYTPTSDMNSAERQGDLNPREKALRDLFVSEYLIDFDQVRAAQRCGFVYQFAVEYSTKFMEEPYVQQRINSIKFQKVDEKQMADFDRTRIKNALMAEAHNRGPGSSHAARVAALAKLASMHGLDAPKKSEQTVLHKGGVMAVPGIANLDDWEKAASASQDQLVDHARTS